MSYRILITETRAVTRLAGKDWKVVGQKEIEREERFCGEGLSKTRMENVYGYTPEIEKPSREEVEVYKQVVDSLDLVAVIAAVNRGMTK